MNKFKNDILKGFLEDLDMEDDYNPGITIDKFFSFQPQMTEEVEEKDIVKWEIAPEGDRAFLVPLYDVHTGSRTMFRSLFEKTVQFILDTPNCYTILGGDILESATRQSIGLGIFDEHMHLSEQMRYIETTLAPLVNKGKVLGAITGNHEMRPTYLNGWNPMEEIAHALDIPYLGYQGYILLNVSGQEYKIFIHHGTGGGRTKGAKVNAATRPNQVAIADVYITGHLHDRFAIPDTIFDIEDGRLIQKQRWYVAAGSFLQYFGGYPEMKMLSPSLTGALLLEFSGNSKSVRVHM